MDWVSLFAAAVFGGAWYLRSRVSADDPLARLFLGVLMALAAAIGFLGLLLRALSASVA
jgi:hypothetical protein